MCAGVPQIPQNASRSLKHYVVSRWDAPLDSGLRDRALLDPGGTFERRIGCRPDTLVLVRPDDHIAAIETDLRSCCFRSVSIRRRQTARMRVEKDVEIPMRDGARLRADVLRAERGRVPAIMNLGIYQKDKVWIPPPDLEENGNPHMVWETANPDWWVPRGYALVRVDSRGSGKSPGRTDPWSPAEAQDFYDAIEWAARQPWCNGAVGLSGISYYAMTQWLVANLRPPSLKAIIPWEGAADMYRDFAFHGGIFSFGFAVNWFHNQMANHLLGRPQAAATDAFSGDWLWDYMRHNLEGDWYHGRQARWEDIKVPFSPQATGAAWACTCAATPRPTCAPVAAQAPAPPRRHAHPSVSLRGRPTRPAALVRLLAQGRGQRRAARAAGQAADPQGWRRQIRVAS